MNCLKNLSASVSFLVFGLLLSCGGTNPEGIWDFELYWDDEPANGTMVLKKENDNYSGYLNSFDIGKVELEHLDIVGDALSADFQKWDMTFTLNGTFNGDGFEGTLVVDDEDLPFLATRQDMTPVVIDRSGISYILSDNDLQETELNIDHAGLLESADEGSYERGSRIYNTNCINCHGNPEIEGSIPLSLKFWEQPFKAGGDPFSMYQTITRGYGAMPPQLTLTPREKYDVITYIREEYVRDNEGQYFKVTGGYLSELPKGTSKGPEPQPYHPWSDQDYGNFFINTYELVDEETGPERYHSPGPTPFPDEDYSQNNFAYKGIAIRLDEGPGGVSDGKAWMIFDHDVMRVAGGWTGDGFIDWDGILLNDRHETYPRTIGKLHFETPVGPGWANPVDGSFDDPRFTARDGRQFGPLPRKWADYKGLYHHGNNIVISYSVGSANILEKLGMLNQGSSTLFTRTLNISPSASILKLRVAPVNTQVKVKGTGATLTEEDGYIMMNVQKSRKVNITLFIADKENSQFDEMVENAPAPENLSGFLTGGPAHYPEIINSPITKGDDSDLLAIDQLSPPYENPWNCRMKLSGIDFMSDGNKAAACTTDGDIWMITGLTDGSNSLKWQRIGAGLFQRSGSRMHVSRLH